MSNTSPPWIDNPLEYLVRIRFPMERHYKTVFPTSFNGPRAHRDDAYIKQASEYRDELLQLPEAKLRELAEAAWKDQLPHGLARQRAEEGRLFFNQPGAVADVQHWARMSSWSLEEAVALSLGKDPRRVDWDKVRGLVGVSRFAAEYQARRDIIFRAKSAGQLSDPAIPGVFIAWAERMKLDLPSPLTEAIKDLGVQVADWKTAYEAQKRIADNAEAELAAERKAGIQRSADHVAYIEKLGSGYRELIDRYEARVKTLENAARQANSVAPIMRNVADPATEKPLGARERESLLKLVIGMALGGYGYDPKPNRSNVISEIASDLEKAGVPLDVDTVRKHIRAGRDLLPTPEAE